MPRMTVLECAQIVDKALAKTEVTIDDDAKFNIARIAQGMPYYVHVIGQSAAYAAIDCRRTRITMADVANGLEAATENTISTIRTHYQQALRSARTEKYPQVLLACAFTKSDDLGFFTASAVRKPLEVFMGSPAPVSSFAKHLEKLCDDSRGAVLEKRGEPRRYAYRFKDSLVPPYVGMRGLEQGLITPAMLDVLFPSDMVGSSQELGRAGKAGA